MLRVGFEPTTPVFELAKTVIDVDGAAIVIGHLWVEPVTKIPQVPLCGYLQLLFFEIMFVLL
jgi:hypothetical protein